MATPLELALQHRRAQAALKEALEAYLKRTYLSMLGPRDTRQLAERWVALVLPYVLAYRRRSEALARSTYRRSRDLALLGSIDFFEPADDDFAPEALETSLLVTGLYDLLERIAKGEPFDEALPTTATAAAGAGVRHALNGGRSYYERAIAADRVALGWYRVTKAGACSFCAVLASRGAVYKEDSFRESDPRFIGGGEEKVHDHCVCTMQAIWRRDQDTPELNQEYAKLWESSTRGYSGQDALNAFRRAYEAVYPSAA